MDETEDIFQTYNNEVWRDKLGLDQYQTLEKRWRSRWDFAVARIASGSTVLDAGCGDGVLGSFLIRDKNCQVSGLDVSDYALEIAKQKGLNVTRCNISADKYPFQDQLFDYVLFSCSLEHIMDPIHAVREAKRVLKEDGHLIVTIPNVANISNRVSFLTGKTPKEFLHDNTGEGMHLRFYNFGHEFERDVLAIVGGLRVAEKSVDFKNPRLYSGIRRWVLKLLMRIAPNTFGQYSHFVIVKDSISHPVPSKGHSTQ